MRVCWALCDQSVHSLKVRLCPMYAAVNSWRYIILVTLRHWMLVWIVWRSNPKQHQRACWIQTVLLMTYWSQLLSFFATQRSGATKKETSMNPLAMANIFNTQLGLTIFNIPGRAEQEHSSELTCVHAIITNDPDIKLCKFQQKKDRNIN